jgi:glyoxylase-like metal-dependent hydrolase (beta-lactamase superfamily II)
MLIRLARVRHALAVAGGLLAPAALVAQSPQQLVARALDAMGGVAAVRALTSVTADYYGATYGLGQSETPESPPRATIAYGRISTDWAGMRRLRIQEARTITGAVQRTRRVTAGGIGLLETDGRPAADGAGAVAANEQALRREPDRLLLAALDHPQALSSRGTTDWRGETLDAVGFALGPDTLTLLFDRSSGQLTGVATLTDDPILGDRHTVTWYTRWQDAGGVRLPRQVDVTVNGHAAAHTVYTTVATNAPLDDALFAIPDSIARAAPRGPVTPPVVTVSLVELAPGVWRAEGGSHHSLVVEQERELVVVEAPQSTARMQAVLDTLRSRFPDKRVGTVVNTHYHWDHAGGVRAVIAAGIPVVTHARNAAFVSGIARAPKTVAPDALSRSPRDARIRQVTDSLVLGAGDRRVAIYALPNAHVEGMLVAYVPVARVLFVSDVLPGNPATVATGSREVLAATRRWGITVARIAGGHGAVMDWAAVERAAGGS